MKTLCLAVTLILPLAAAEPLAQRIVHADPAKYRPSKAVHNGAGQLDYMALFDAHSLDTNLYFLHRGIIEPKSGIGAHFHNQCEEMFVIFDGEAQFTIDGRTSLLKGPAGAPCRMGHSHAIYNPTDKVVQWMNINVSAMKNTYDAFNLDDARVRRAARSQSRPVHGDAPRPRAAAPRGRHERRQGDRPVPPRAGHHGLPRALGLRGPPDASSGYASTGPHLHREVAEFYYVMNGQGTVTISAAPAGRGGAG
jgi:mannose-6-phosphate isomerase-like protein (cupin superfamily)